MQDDNGSHQLHAGYYVVAWIDILGQEQELDEIRIVASSPDKSVSDKERELEKRISACCRRLTLVRASFTTGCGIKRTNPPQNTELTKEQQGELDAINSFDPPTFQGFGDTVIAFTPVKNCAGKLTMQAVDTFLGGCAMAILTFLAEHLPIRGAVDVGFGFDCFEGEIYGPVSASVHKLEDKIAGYPRIVIGDGLRRYLTRFDVSRPDACLNDGFNHELAGFCQEMIVPDVDGVPILDYAGPAVRERLSAWGEMNDTLRRARGFSNQEYAKFVSAGDRKHALLERYLNSRVQN